MDFEKILTFSSGIASIIGLIFVFITPSFVSVGISASLFFGAIGWWFGYHRRLELLPYTIIKVSNTLRLNEGLYRANLESHLNLRSNARRRDIIFSNFSADGHMDNFRWNNVPIPPHDIIPTPPGSSVMVRFDSDRVINEKFTGVLSFDYINSFDELRRTEYYGYICSYPTKKLSIKIIFPDEKIFCNVEFHRIIGGDRIKLSMEDVKITGQTISANAKNPMIGAKYMLTWNW